MKRKLVENFFSKRILSVPKIWSNAFQLDYLPFCVFVDNLQRCSIVPLYALLEEGQNDPICDGSNFLSMYKKEMRSAFFDLILFAQYLLWRQSVSNSSKCREFQQKEK